MELRGLRAGLISAALVAGIAACGGDAKSDGRADAKTSAPDAGPPPSGDGGNGGMRADGGVAATGGGGGSAGSGGAGAGVVSPDMSGGSSGRGGQGGAARSGSGGTTTGTAGGAGRGAPGTGGSGGQVTVGGTGGSPGAGGPGGAAGGMPGGVGGTGLVACGRCSAYAMPMQTGTIGPTELNALSGLAVSRLQPDIVFAHNDHDRAVVYAIDLQGREHARITLSNASATDIEDIAVGPCGTQSCIYLADIGDNPATRSEYALLRFPAPMVPTAPGSAAMTASAERFRFVYEDGSHNAEGVMVGPDGAVYIVTKLAPSSGGRVAATGPSSIYRLPASMTPGSVARATKVATLTVPATGDLAASAAAAHPCGLGFLLRTYDRVYEFTTPTGMGFEAAFAATPRSVATPDEPQSEGIDYRADGRGFITSGEAARAPVVQTSCAP